MRNDKKHFEELNAKDFKNSEDAGGKTGSMRATYGESAYQLKLPIQLQSLARRTKALYRNHENMGEFLAAGIAEIILKKPEKKLTPEVFLVNFPGNSFGVASKYFPNSVILDSYLSQGPAQLKIDSKTNHIQITDFFVKKMKKENPEMIKGIARMIVLSSILGDHDINPGNLVVLRDQDNSIGRIDFGHAFSDLISFKVSALGGGATYKENFILDFFNRNEINGGPSKLWRDYPGLCPSQTLIDVMSEFDLESVANVWDFLEDFGKYLESIKEKHSEKYEKMFDALEKIFKNISSEKDLKIYNNTEDQNKKQVIILSGLKNFVQNNISDLMAAKTIMQIQVSLVSAIEENDKAKIERVKHDFLVFCEEKGIKQENFLWFKDRADEAPFVGTPDKFIFTKKHKIQLNIDRIDDLELCREKIECLKEAIKTLGEPSSGQVGVSKYTSLSDSITEAVTIRELMLISAKHDPIEAFHELRKISLSLDLNPDKMRIAKALFDHGVINGNGQVICYKVKSLPPEDIASASDDLISDQASEFANLLNMAKVERDELMLSADEVKMRSDVISEYHKAIFQLYNEVGFEIAAEILREQASELEIMLRDKIQEEQPIALSSIRSEGFILKISLNQFLDGSLDSYATFENKTKVHIYDDVKNRSIIGSFHEVMQKIENTYTDKRTRTDKLFGVANFGHNVEKYYKDHYPQNMTSYENLSNAQKLYLVMCYSRENPNRQTANTLEALWVVGKNSAAPKI